MRQNESMTTRRTATIASIAAVVIAVIIAAAILLITLTPHHVDRDMGTFEYRLITAVAHVPGLGWFDYTWLERLANVIMFAPLAALVTYLAGIRRWWIVLLGCALLSAAIELTQLLFLPDRTASVGDVVSNTIGAAVGIGIIALARLGRG
ncbi:hypothetical protein BH11ACT2_BH11ACT2_16920 [soil metagenome]